MCTAPAHKILVLKEFTSQTTAFGKYSQVPTKFQTAQLIMLVKGLPPLENTNNIKLVYCKIFKEF